MGNLDFNVDMSEHLPNKLHIEVESGATGDDVSCPLLSVAQLGRHNQASLLAYKYDHKCRRCLEILWKQNSFASHHKTMINVVLPLEYSKSSRAARVASITIYKKGLKMSSLLRIFFTLLWRCNQVKSVNKKLAI